MAAAGTITIASADPRDEDAWTLVGAMEAEIDGLYGDRDGSIHGITATAGEMSPPDGGFIVVRDSGRPVGCGGFKRIGDGVCEIKRMYLRPESRGTGLAADLLAAIEAEAKRAGFVLARLDTGDRQPAAERLYTGAGYREIDDYNGNEVARHWYEKELR
ncbi:GNAT family N-acetyltransferase [Thermoleophilia bacterium SCSIO 60948]|nr:GNAT family N-acetyltransferase [Thermoleophilia bacterium SCSIO 60948]